MLTKKPQELRSVKFAKKIYNDIYTLVAGFKALDVKCSVRSVVEKSIANYLPQLQKELEALKGRDV